MKWILTAITLGVILFLGSSFFIEPESVEVDPRQTVKESLQQIEKEQMHTLTQISIALTDPHVSNNTIYMQLYFYNDLYAELLRRLMGLLAYAFKAPLREILGRLVVIKGYLHSDISSRIIVRLEPGENGRLVVEGKPNDQAERALKKIAKKIKVEKAYLMWH